jgi:hypothetical protein
LSFYGRVIPFVFIDFHFLFEEIERLVFEHERPGAAIYHKDIGSPRIFVGRRRDGTKDPGI